MGRGGSSGIIVIGRPALFACPRCDPFPHSVWARCRAKREEPRMSWSITIGRIFGSEIRIHLTFLIFLAWIAIAEYTGGGSNAAINGVLFIVAFFACVLLHELGHAVAARRYGIA